MAKRVFILGAITFLLMAGLYWFLGIQQSFFSRLWWWDILMHGIGGVLAGLIGIWWGIILGYRPSITSALLGALVLGIAVELVEFGLDLPRSPFLSYPIDVTKDIVVDMMGGWASLLLIKKRS